MTRSGRCTDSRCGSALTVAIVSIFLALGLWASSYKSAGSAAQVQLWSATGELASTPGSSAVLAQAIDMLHRGTPASGDGRCSLTSVGPGGANKKYVVHFKRLGATGKTWQIEVDPARPQDNYPLCSVVFPDQM